MGRRRHDAHLEFSVSVSVSVSISIGINIGVGVAVGIGIGIGIGILFMLQYQLLLCTVIYPDHRLPRLPRMKRARSLLDSPQTRSLVHKHMSLPLCSCQSLTAVLVEQSKTWH